MVGTHHITRRNQTEQRKNERHQRIGTTNKHQNTQIISLCDTIFRKIYTKTIRKNRQYAANIEKRDNMGMDGRTQYRLQTFKERTNDTAMPSILQR